jgi:hypothetical protein
MTDISHEFVRTESALELISVKFACDLTPYDEMIDEVVKNHHQRVFRKTARKNMRRLITVLTAFTTPNSEGEYMATKPIIEWCASYIVKNLQRMIDILTVVSSDDGTLDVGQRVAELVLGAGAVGISEGNIVSGCRPYRALSVEKRKEILEKLVSDKEIKVGVMTKQISGRSTKRVVHSKYSPFTVMDD